MLEPEIYFCVVLRVISFLGVCLPIPPTAFHLRARSHTDGVGLLLGVSSLPSVPTYAQERITNPQSLLRETT